MTYAGSLIDTLDRFNFKRYASPMEMIGSESFDLDLGRRLFIIVSFLLVLWYLLRLIVTKVQTGELKVPQFLINRFPSLKNIELGAKSSELYKIDIVQRKIMPDGSEFMVIDIDGRHLLVSKHIQSGINYIADLNNIVSQ